MALKAYGKIWNDGDITIVFATNMQRAAQAMDVLGDPTYDGIFEIDERIVDGLMFNGSKITINKDDDCVRYTMIEEFVTSDSIVNGIKAGKHISVTARDMIPLHHRNQKGGQIILPSPTVVITDDRDEVLKTIRDNPDRMCALIVKTINDLMVMGEFLKNEKNVKVHLVYNVLTGVDLSDRVGIFFNMGERIHPQLLGRFNRI